MRTVLFIHLVTVAFWLGGQLLLFAVVTPALRGMDPDERRAIFRRVGQTYGMVSVPVLLVLLITGGVMAAHYNLNPSDSAALQHKLEAVGVVLIGTVVHAIAGAKGATTVARVGSVVTLGATLVAVWFATGL